MTFRMVALGDSIMWGQGLANNNKFTTKVQTWLQQKLGVDINLQLLAHSGASIARQPQDDSSFGSEVPTHYPSIISQTKKVENPQDVELILLNGGINDISIDILLNPLTDVDFIKNWANNDLANLLESLFNEVINTFPKATIIFTGYYPIISAKTEVLSLTAFFSAINLANNPTTRAIRDKLADQSVVWSQTSTQTIKNVIKGINNRFDNQKIFFAQPLFEPENSYGASNTYLWLLGQTDEVTSDRVLQCTLAARLLDPVCLAAPTGHPNLKGSDAFATAIQREIVRFLEPPFALSSTSIHAPSTTEFNNKPLVVWSDTTSNHSLRLRSANTSDNWDQEIVLTDNSLTSAAICYFKNKLYIAWSDQSLSLKLKSSVNGNDWTDEISLNHQTPYQPVLSVHQDKLFLSWINLMDGHKIHLAVSEDGVTWVEKPSLQEVSIDSPSLASFNNKLFLAWNNPQIDNQLCIISSDDNGDSWQNREELNYHSASAPYLYSYNNLIHLAWVKRGLMPNIRIAHSEDGVNFKNITKLYENSDHRPVLMSYFGKLAVLWTSRDRENHLKLLEI